MILDYFVVKKQNYSFGEGVTHRFCSLPAVIAWIAGCTVGYTVHWGISSLNSIIIAGIVYIIAFFILKRNSHLLYLGGIYVEDSKGAVTRINE